MSLKSVLYPALAALACSCAGSGADSVSSPDGKLVFDFSIADSGTPTYSVKYDGKEVVKPSSLGFRLTDGSVIGRSMKVVGVDHSSFSEKWVPVWGENDSIDNTYHQMVVRMEGDGVKLNLEVRAFDDGVGFRYVFPQQQMDSIRVAEEPH